MFKKFYLDLIFEFVKFISIIRCISYISLVKIVIVNNLGIVILRYVF